MLEIHINGAGTDSDLSKSLREAAELTLREEGVSAGEISITLLDDLAIRALNAEYLARDRVTDVIAFTLHEPYDPVLGDVYIGVEQAALQAREWGVDPHEELLRLCIHGTLHVLGHDHPEGDERLQSPMFQRQEALLRRLLDSDG